MGDASCYEISTYSPVKDIEFVGKKRKNSEVSISIPAAKRNIPPPSSTELSQFFDSLASCSDAKPAVLAVVSPYCDAYVQSSLAPELLMVLSDLYRTEYLSLGYHRLLEIAQNTEINITANQGRAAEAGTRNQANSRLWFRMRCGRITASKFKNACHTDPASPSISLIMAICYPEACCFSTSATCWGCQHESWHWSDILHVVNPSTKMSGYQSVDCSLVLNTHSLALPQMVQ